MYKEIHIGSMLRKRLKEMNISEARVCNFFKLPYQEIEKMFEEKSIDGEIMLKWSKLLEYDFFRIYSQHLILYSPQAAVESKQEKEKIKSRRSRLPRFRKCIYTPEVIDFILELLQTEQKTKKEIIDIYQIPRTTLYKWIQKYGK